MPDGQILDLFPSAPDTAPEPRPEIIVDNFAGGGGASTGIEMALGRSPDVAINHDAEAVALHQANHPDTLHLCQSVWKADPREVMPGYPVGLAWFSPDCKHFSKAKGGKPVSRGVRDLAWVVIHWARLRRPRVIILENVEEFQHWGPLTAENRPDPEHKGRTFRTWANTLRRLGYRVEWRELRACDYGAPTIRKRLFVIARCDGRPIVWPEPNHGTPDSDGVREGLLQPWRTAAEIIDWSRPTPSIFLTREEGRAIRVKRPLADATMRRIARGVVRYVLEAAEPFLVPVTHTGDLRTHAGSEPLRTVTTAKGGEHAVVAPVFAGGGKHGLVSAFLAKHYGGVVGHGVEQPTGTVTTADHHSVVAAHLTHFYSSAEDGGNGDMRRPIKTVTATGQHAGLAAGFLQKYYGTGGQDQGASGPLHTVPTRERFGLVTVEIEGEPWVLADIGMRMLTPRELYRAQGFPDSYRIDVDVDGKRLTKAAQVRMCGNSVCPPLARALAAANVPDLAAQEARAAAAE
jgi:DNA (cytosine-5)-methyltransferase 1